jgi:Carbohydrate family 9 binding domain-like
MGVAWARVAHYPQLSRARLKLPESGSAAGFSAIWVRSSPAGGSSIMLSRCRILSTLFGLSLILLCAAAARGWQPADAKNDLVTRQAVCRWAATPPVLDGKLDDACWKNAAPISRFASFWNQTPRQGTTAYLVWDDDALYYAGTMTDKELRSFGSKRNDSLWDGDVFELFFKPSATKPDYYEFQANPRALVFEVYWPERGKDFGDLTKLPVLGSKAEVVLTGTLDQPGDQDEGWAVEGRIPWSAFAPTGGKPKPGDVWRFALCRYDYGPKGTSPVLMSSAPLTRLSFHRHEDYGSLKFEGP